MELNFVQIIKFWRRGDGRILSGDERKVVTMKHDQHKEESRDPRKKNTGRMIKKQTKMEEGGRNAKYGSRKARCKKIPVGN